MNTFLTLLKLQLYLKLSALKPSHWLPKNPASFKDWKPLLTGGFVFLLLASVISTVVFMASGILWAFEQMNVPELLMATVVMLMMAMTFVVGFFHVISMLFFNRDSSFLAGLPVSSRTVMAVRLAVVLLGEIALTALVFLPVSILYGIRTGQGLLFYVKAFAAIPFIPCLPLAAATLLSFMLIRISSIFRHRDRFAVIGGFIIMALIIPFQMQLYTRIPENAGADYFLNILSSNRALLEGLAGGFPPVLWITTGIVEQGATGFFSFLLFLFTSGAFIMLPVVIGKHYLQLAILQSETFQSTKHHKLSSVNLDRSHSLVIAMFLREWKEVLRVPAYALNGLVGIILMPMMMVALFVSKESSSELSAILGELMRAAGGIKITLFAAAGMAIVGTVNTAGATAVSREGKHISFAKMIPVPYATQLIAKHLFGFSINFLSCLTTTLALIILVPTQTLYIIAAFILGLLFCYASNALGLALDASHPKLNWRNETEAIKQNPMSLVNMVLGLAAAGALGTGIWGLGNIGIPLSTLTWMLGIFLGLLAFTGHMFLLRQAGKWYNRIEL